LTRRGEPSKRKKRGDLRETVEDFVRALRHEARGAPLSGRATRSMRHRGSNRRGAAQRAADFAFAPEVDHGAATSSALAMRADKKRKAQKR